MVHIEIRLFLVANTRHIPKEPLHKLFHFRGVVCKVCRSVAIMITEERVASMAKGIE